MQSAHFDIIVDLLLKCPRRNDVSRDILRILHQQIPTLQAGPEQFLLLQLNGQGESSISHGSRLPMFLLH